MFTSDKILYQTIGKNVKHHREEKGLTQAQLSELTSLSISYISKIEADKCHKSFSISALNQIANALNTEITAFFREDPQI